MSLSILDIQAFLKPPELTFLESTHKYVNFSGTTYTSVSGLLGAYQEPFDADKISFFVAKKQIKEKGLFPDYNLIQQYKKAIMKEWDDKRDNACIKGSRVHSFAEDFLGGKILLEEDLYKTYCKDTKKTIAYAKQFLLDTIYSKDSPYIPVKPEVVFYNHEFQISGMSDLMVYNKNTDKLEIWDWKTNGKFTLNTDSKYDEKGKPIRYLINSLSYLQNNKYNIYALQLSLYQYMAMQLSGLSKDKFDRKIIWFKPMGEGHEIYESNYMEDEVNIIINEHKQKLNTGNIDYKEIIDYD